MRVPSTFLTDRQVVPSCLPMAGICEGRVAIVTGAARGIGRGHALEFAHQGAKVVVNDIGAALDGTGRSDSPARQVVDEIVAGGGAAVVNGDDVADWEGARQLVRTALDTFGRLDVVVNNAGFVRDRMFVSCGEGEWDAVMRVHLKGHFAVARFAAEHWRERAKAGIATLTLVQAAELGRYGVTANAIAPSARTRMTETVFADTMAAPGDPGAFDAMAAENVAPLVVWLGSPQSAHVTGRVFEVEGGRVSVADGWQHGPAVDNGARWDPAELGPVVDDLLAKAPAPAPVYGAQ